MRFSQNFEEDHIAKFFDGFTGTVLDIGANDGVTFSNSRRLLFDNGWSGLLIEASPKAYRRLSLVYEKVSNIQTMCCVVAAKDGELTFYESGEHLGKGDVGLLSTTKPDEMKRWGAAVDFKERTVQCLSFASVMKLSRFQTFDFITIDIEGMELDVLPQMNFDRLGTKMVCVEFNGKNEDKFTEIMKGFKLIHKNAENLIYVRIS